MCTAGAARARGGSLKDGGSFASAADAVRIAADALDYLNGACAGLDGGACAELLPAVGEVRAKLTAAEAGLLRRFDAAGAHDADGYGSSSAWLAARAGMTGKAARAAVRQMRLLGERPRLGAALAAGAVTDSLALAMADWTRKQPPTPPVTGSTTARSGSAPRSAGPPSCAVT